jgi:predicted transcriptional regulator
MEVVSIKVDKKTREKMRRLANINWSETIRRAIDEVIEREEMAERNVDPREIRQGLKIAESIRRPSKKGWDSTAEIRKWRDQRR